MARINKQLQRELALILESRIKKNSVKDAIITGVECSSDLERAKVFFTAANPAKRKHLRTELQSIKGALRSLLGQSIRLRRVPDLEFVMDTSADYGAKIDKILDSLGLINNSAEVVENFEDDEDYDEAEYDAEDENEVEDEAEYEDDDE